MLERKREVHLPTWLWFFLALALGLVTTLLYRYKRVLQHKQAERLDQLSQQHPPSKRYSEPTSIPLERHFTRSASTIQPGSPEAELNLDEVEFQSTSEEPAAPEKAATLPGMDDLKRIEGIGPAISRLLFENDIKTFAQLAETPVERLDEILTAVKLRRLADPGTWPEQAALAAAGDWDALQKLQLTLKGGRRKNGNS